MASSLSSDVGVDVAVGVTVGTEVAVGIAGVVAVGFGVDSAVAVAVLVNSTVGVAVDGGCVGEDVTVGKGVTVGAGVTLGVTVGVRVEDGLTFWTRVKEIAVAVDDGSTVGVVLGDLTSGNFVAVAARVKGGGDGSVSGHSTEINPCELSKAPTHTAPATPIIINAMSAQMRQGRCRRRMAR